MGYAEDLLRLCQDLQSCADEDVLGLFDRIDGALLEQLRTVQEGDDQLSRAMVAASGLLLKLSASLCQQWLAAERAPARRPHLALRLAAACAVAQHLASVLRAPGLGTEAQEAVLPCVALLLEPGLLMLSDTATAGGAAASAELVERCNNLRWAAFEFLRLLMQSADVCGAAGKLAALMPPGPTIAFLSAAVALGPVGNVGVARARCLSIVCRQLLDHLAFGRHADLIQADAVLQQRLVALLSPFVSLCGAVLSLPPERRPPGHEEGAMWKTVGCAASVLGSARMELGMRLHLAPQQHPGAGFSSNARRLLAASSQLLAATPLQVQPDLQNGPHELAVLLLNLTQLMSTAASYMSGQVTQLHASWPWGSTPHRLQPARLLAQALACLPAVLPATVGALQHESVVFSATLTAGNAIAHVHLRAMAAAHVPALQVLCDLAGSTADLQAGDLGLLVVSLAQCAEFGAPAMATRANTTRLLAEAAKLLGTTRGPGASAGIAMEQLGVWDAIECALRSPRLAAVLLDCGVVDWALRDAIKRLATPSVVDQETFYVRTANLLTAMGDGWDAVIGDVADADSIDLSLGELARALAAAEDSEDSDRLALLQRQALPPATHVAAALLEHWRRPEQQQEDTLALAQAAAARSCAYLRCANVAQEGGPAAGQGDGSAKCSACRAVWYCSEACSHADWRGSGSGQHKRCCRALKAAREASRQAAQ